MLCYAFCVHLVLRKLLSAGLKTRRLLFYKILIIFSNKVLIIVKVKSCIFCFKILCIFKDLSSNYTRLLNVSIIKSIMIAYGLFVQLLELCFYHQINNKSTHQFLHLGKQLFKKKKKTTATLKYLGEIFLLQFISRQNVRIRLHFLWYFISFDGV